MTHGDGGDELLTDLSLVARIHVDRRELSAPPPKLSRRSTPSASCLWPSLAHKSRQRTTVLTLSTGVRV
jgi:hypothetical protein